MNNNSAAAAQKDDVAMDQLLMANDINTLVMHLKKHKKFSGKEQLLSSQVGNDLSMHLSNKLSQVKKFALAGNFIEVGGHGGLSWIGLPGATAAAELSKKRDSKSKSWSKSKSKSKSKSAGNQGVESGTNTKSKAGAEADVEAEADDEEDEETEECAEANGNAGVAKPKRNGRRMKINHIKEHLEHQMMDVPPLDDEERLDFFKEHFPTLAEHLNIVVDKKTAFEKLIQHSLASIIYYACDPEDEDSLDVIKDALSDVFPATFLLVRMHDRQLRSSARARISVLFRASNHMMEYAKSKTDADADGTNDADATVVVATDATNTV
jgi:hypothetical protein